MNRVIAFALAAFIPAWVGLHFNTLQEEPRFYQCQIEPREGENFSLADVQCWLPPSNLPVDNLLCIVLHPHGRGGVEFQDPQPWITLAMRHHSGLLSISFIAHDKDSIPWCHASKGTGRALVAAIDEIADKDGAHGLKGAPLVMAGICEAGQFAYEFAAFTPDRTKAFFTMGGGQHDSNVAEKAASIPGLLVAATDRGEEPFHDMFALFERGRKSVAPWAFSAEPIKDYDKGWCSEESFRFLENMLEAQGSSSSNTPPKTTLTLPLAEKKLMPEGLPPNIQAMIAEAAGSGLSSAFSDQSTAQAWQENREPDRSSGLSFVSVPLPEAGKVTPATSEMGVISLDSGPHSAFFDIQCEPKLAVDQVVVKTVQNGVTCSLQQRGACAWQLECTFDPRQFVCGTFHAEIPIRFLHRGQIIPGGISAFAVGRIIGDIRTGCNSIAVGVGDNGGSDVEHLRLTSASGHDIQILGIQSTFPDWAKATVCERSGAVVDIQCTFNPPPELRGQGFYGYFLIRSQSNEPETTKVAFYGS